MVRNKLDISDFSIIPADIDTEKCLSNLQKLTVPDNIEIAEHLLKHIFAIIQKEITTDLDNEPLVNQVVLNLSFRCYYQLLHKHKLEDRYFHQLPEDLNHKNEVGFNMLFAILLTEHRKHLNPLVLQQKCIEEMLQAIQENSSSLLAILKALNLLVKKFPTLDMPQLELEHFYYCLQSGPSGMREEVLTLFNHCCKQEQRAFGFFQLLIEFFPWTNRNKYYLLSCVLNSHSLLTFLHSAEHNKVEFFAGLRTSLNYKCLLAPSQYLIKSLSAQNSNELLLLSVELLTHGSLAEIQNYYSQWFGRIKQQDSLFELLQTKSEISEFLQDASARSDSTENYRLILIFSIFSKQLYNLSKLHFFKISTELLMNCFNHETDAQLLIFKFLVNNLCNFATEDSLEFLCSFIKRHKCVESAQFRNNVLGKMPTIINYISLQFNRSRTHESNTLAISIVSFFRELHQMIDLEICNDIYQPKIFALKMLEILLNSLYAQNVAKNAKNCSTQQNQQLGDFLMQEGVFDSEQMSCKLLQLLNDPLGFDDALELIVSILKQLNKVEYSKVIDLCLDFCNRCNIDDCALCPFYARVTVHSFRADEDALKTYKFAMDELKHTIESFQRDPLLITKTKNHLFGYLTLIDEVVRAYDILFVEYFQDILTFLNNVLNIILDMLNLANLRNKQDCSAASFQDMDESLQLLVLESQFEAHDHEECRKFLLLSFWLTLKACCDLATSIGCILVRTVDNEHSNFDAIDQCLKINVAVLTRCRHKGAIEAAGISIGKLTKCITAQLPINDKRYQLLHNCIAELFDDAKQVSTTRRGAGFSIMFLHIVKNEEQRSRPLLKRAMHQILQHLTLSTESNNELSNHDRMEALTLHYLCVLVKDTELRIAMSKYYNEIMLAAISHIDNTDWTICNAALQLFGALIPKLVGQRQATEFDTPLKWEPTELSYSELSLKLPNTCQHIITYCMEERCKSTATRSIILFIGFLSKVEHLRTSFHDSDCERILLERLRSLMWLLLRHRSEKVRKLAATCFVRAHEFRSELPSVLLATACFLKNVRDENFFQGLIFLLHEGVLKIQHEFSIETQKLTTFMEQLNSNLIIDTSANNFKRYTLTKLFGLLELFSYYGQKNAVCKMKELHFAGEPCSDHELLGI